VGLGPVRAVGADDLHLTTGLLEKGEVEEPIDDVDRAGRARPHPLDPESVVIVVVELLGLLDDQRDVPNPGHDGRSSLKYRSANITPNLSRGWLAARSASACSDCSRIAWPRPGPSSGNIRP